MTITNPEICLVEDPENINSRAIVLNSTILYKQVNKPDGESHYIIHARQMEAYKCLLKKEIDTSLAIIAPFDWTLKYSVDPQKNLEETSLTFEPIAINFSFLDFKLIYALYNRWFPSQSSESQTETSSPSTTPKTEVEKEKGLKKSLSLYSENEKEFLRENEREILMDDEREKIENTSLDLEEKKKQTEILISEEENSKEIENENNEKVKKKIYKFHSAEMEIKLIDDSDEENLPISLVTINGMNIIYVDTPELFKTKINADICLICEVFNHKLQVWETLIENWPVQVNYLLNSINENNKTKISLNAQEKLEITLSKETLSTLYHSYLNCSKDYNEMENKTKREFKYPFYITNQTGILLWYWTSTLYEDKENTMSDPKELKNGKTEALLSRFIGKGGSRKFMRSEKQNEISLSFKLDGDYLTVKDVSLERTGKQVITIDPNKKLQIVCEISNFHGSKLISIRSPVRIENRTTHSLRILSQYGDEPPEELKNLQCGKTVCLTIKQSLSKLRFSPFSKNSNEYIWSKEGLPCHELQPNNYLISCSSTNPNSLPLLYYCVVDETLKKGMQEERHPEEHSISLYPPYILQNLLNCPLEFRIVYAENKNVVESGILKKGETISLMIDVRKQLCLTIKIAFFNWSKLKTITGSNVERGIQILDVKGNSLDLHLRINRLLSGVTELSIFCDFWIINESGLPLLYKKVSFSSQHIAAGQLEQLTQIEDIEEKGGEVSPHNTSIFKETFVFSYDRNIVGKEKLSIRTINTDWSKPVPIRKNSILECTQIKNGDKTFILGVNVERAPGKFWRTFQVVIYPRFILVNNSPHVLKYQQSETGVESILEADQQDPFYWHTVKKPRLLSVKTFIVKKNKDQPHSKYGTKEFEKEMKEELIKRNKKDQQTEEKEEKGKEEKEGKEEQEVKEAETKEELEWNYCTGFSIEKENEKFVVKMRNARGECFLLKVETMLKDGVMLVIFSNESDIFPTYKIFNKSSYKIRLRQLGVKSTLYQYLEVGTSAPFAWDKPQTEPRYLYVEMCREEEEEDFEESEHPNILVDLSKFGKSFIFLFSQFFFLKLFFKNNHNNNNNKNNDNNNNNNIIKIIIITIIITIIIIITITITITMIITNNNRRDI